MQSIISYLEEEKRSFKEFPFNDVDSLILSSLSYMDYDGVIPSLNDNKEFKYYRSLAFLNKDKMVASLVDKKLNIRLVNAVVKSSRFHDLKVNYFENIYDYDKQMQFSAVTFIVDNKIYVGYRGTDASLIGWKEDFNMAYMAPVPAQVMAVKYLNKVARKVGGYIYLGGHSKGGNLAIYAGIYTNLINQFRIKKIYCHDGPGFRKEIYENIKYKVVKNKISKTIPSASIVGMILNSRENFKIVKSKAISILQHSAFSWVVENSDFVYLESLSKDAMILDSTITNWLDEIDDEKRKTFVNTLYAILSNEEFTSTIDIQKNWFKYYKVIKNNMNKIDKDTKKMIDEVLKRLVTLGIANIKNR